MQQAAKKEILTLLSRRKGWLFKREIEDYMKSRFSINGDTVARRLRELAEDEIIDKTFTHVGRSKLRQYKAKTKVKMYV